MPRLTPLQWLLLVLFLFFYGFAVFAVTRDYYVRTLARPAASSPHAAAARPAPAPLPPPSAIPQTITETNLDLLRQQGDDLFSQRRHAEAVPIYLRIIELAPQDVEAHNDLGLALHYLGDTAGALAKLRAGAALDASHQRIWLTLGFVNLQAGDEDAARSALEHARDLDPSTPIGQEATRLLDLIGG
ncbi:MAG: tetratricopeptide repeat protein [Sphingobacteriia bacterium]|nr:tetratricopeptide repeat protein [Sphingobacteriia bacterium]NCC38578.1 tetratricopeptide repeat protein [Gammaproteobacteria bacterium]